MKPWPKAGMALIAALALGACSSTGTGSPDPEPEPFPKLDDALAGGLESAMVSSDGISIASGSAVVSLNADGDELTVEAGGNTYALAGGPGGPYSWAAWDKPVNYASYGFTDGTYNAALYLGQYVALTTLMDGTGNFHFMQGGLGTPSGDLPEQTAAYEGRWGVVDSNVAQAYGLFDAEADFDAGTIAFALTEEDGTTSIGAGLGTISGNSFASTFNVTGGPYLSTNNAEGAFYGPAAEEMAGLVEGVGLGLTYGYLFGHQK